MVVPVLGEAKALKAEKLLATVEKTEPYYDDFVRLSKELEGKSADEAVKILSKERFIAKTGEELKTYLNSLSDLPKGVTYEGDFIKSVRNDIPGANTNPKIIDDYATQYLDHRYSKIGESGYYASQTNDGNIIEMGFSNGNDISKYNRYKFKNVKINYMLDLTDDAVRKKLGITEDMIKLLGDNKYQFSHEIGTWAKDRYRGIIYPGAQGGNYTNIIIFKQQDVTSILQNITPIPIK